MRLAKTPRDQEGREKEYLLLLLMKYGSSGAHAGTPEFRITRISYSILKNCYLDVGGGLIKNGTKPSLQRITLRWMVGESFDANTKILFKKRRSSRAI